MNQHRWTCLTTVVLTTVLAPIATVHAKSLSSPAVGSANPSFIRSLPVITPLTVTELDADVAIPAAIKPVPQVSKLPIVTPLKHPPRQGKKIANRAIQSQLSPPQIVATAPVFNPQARLIDPIIAVPIPFDSSASPQGAAREFGAQVPTSTFNTQAISAQIPVVRGDGSPATIVNSATVQAEIAPVAQPVPMVTPADSAVAVPPQTAVQPIPQLPPQIAAIDRDDSAHLPQPVPIVSHIDDRPETPSFEAGSPVFVFDHERPQQIVATAIAQIDGTTVAPEPSIAIPVQRPKQSTFPTQTPTVQPLDTSVVSIDQPAATVKPALDQIVATQIGQASWYGSEGGSMTANGEKYNPNGLTAAHRTLPFGTKVRVTSLKTGKTVVVRINDRGPFHGRRIIDVSAGAAEAIGIKQDGVGDVRMEVLRNHG